MRILLVGGSKSGKSHLAQELCRKLGGKLYYWATMEPTDLEDLGRIERHVLDRDGWGFTTVECGRYLRDALPHIQPDSTVLFDSVTAYLANEMFGETICRCCRTLRRRTAANKHLPRKFRLRVR